MHYLGLTIAALVILMAWATPVAYASMSRDIIEEQLKKEAGTLPDNPFYMLKRFVEQIELWFAFNDVEKTKIRYKHAETRLAEAVALIEKNKTDMAKDVIKEYNKAMNDMAANLKDIHAIGKNDTALLEHISNTTYKHIIALGIVYEKTPPVAQAAVADVISRSIENREKILDYLGENKEKVKITVPVAGNNTIVIAVPVQLAQNIIAQDMTEKVKENTNMTSIKTLKPIIADRNQPVASISAR